MKNYKSVCLAILTILHFFAGNVLADSINSPNITMNVDTNRSTGAGAGNVAVTVNTVTIAETTLPEYSSGAGKAITFKARPGFQFDPSSNVTALSTTIGFNGAAVNTAAILTPNGTADEVLTFNLTSGTSTTVQDIIRINGIKVKILSALGAVGPAQTTLNVTTSTASGAFSNQGIVAATITKGAADRLVFSKQPGNTQAAADLLPEVKIVDFGGNVVTNDVRNISLSFVANPGSATLFGLVELPTLNGLASWADANDLNITTASSGYTLRAAHSGSNFLTSDTVQSLPFDITAGAPGSVQITLQPTNTAAGAAISVTGQLFDSFNNPTTTNGVSITIDSANNPGGWPLLVDTSLTKPTVNGQVIWNVNDQLRILKATTDYKLSLSGLGAPVLTNSFSVTPNFPAVLTFVQQPSNVEALKPISPPVSVRVADIFNNPVEDGVAVQIELDPSCPGALSNNAALTVGGIATFSSLTPLASCGVTKLLAIAPPTSLFFASEPFRVSAKDEAVIGVKSTELKRNKFFKFNSTGKFTLPTAKLDDPTKNGAALTVQGSTGLVKYTLAKAGWKKNGSDGFKFQGKNCQSVLVSKNALNATCNGKTGSIKLPESQVSIVLALGKGTKKFCGLCGGKVNGKPAQAFNRTNCAKPAICP